MRGFYGSFTDRKSDLQTVIVTHRQVREPLGAQLGEQFEGSSYYTRYIFPLYFYGSVEVFTEAIRIWFYFQVSPVFDHCTCYIITTSAGVPAP